MVALMVVQQDRADEDERQDVGHAPQRVVEPGSRRSAQVAATAFERVAGRQMKAGPQRRVAAGIGRRTPRPIRPARGASPPRSSAAIAMPVGGQTVVICSATNATRKPRLAAAT